MSEHIMWQVWCTSPCEGEELLVLLKFADWADDRGIIGGPPLAGVASLSRMSRGQAMTVIGRLIEKGLLVPLGDYPGDHVGGRLCDFDLIPYPSPDHEYRLPITPPGFSARYRHRRPLYDKKVAVWKKTGGYCFHCSVALDFETFHRDHLVPKSRGGRDDLKNQVPSCEPCNLSKGAKTDWVPPRLRSDRAKGPSA